MLAASAPASAVTLPPPGAGCFAAAASRKSLIVEVWSYIARSNSPLRGVRVLPGPAGVVLHALGGEVDLGERRVRPRARLHGHQLGHRRADGDDAAPQPP